MLTEVVQTRGVEAPEELSRLTFVYDDDFHLTSVVRTEDDDGRVREESWELGWSGDELTTLRRAVKLDGAGELLEVSTLTWQGPKLTTIVTDAGDREERTTAFGYEGSRLEKITVDTVSPDGTSDFKRSFRYSDDDGSLVLVRDELTVNEEKRPDSQVAISHQNGKPVTLTLTRDDSEDVTTVGAVYEEGVLASFTSVFDPGAADAKEATTTTRFAYDDEGRISSAVIPVPDEEGEENPAEDDIRFSLTYEDAEALDLDVTPYGLLAFPLFDLEGGAARELVEETQTARLAELVW